MASHSSTQTESEHQETTSEGDDWRDVSEAVGTKLQNFLSGDDTESAGPSFSPGSGGTDGTSRSRSDNAQALVRSILNGLQEPTMVADIGGQITHINVQAQRLYGTTETEAVGERPHALQVKNSSASKIVIEALDNREDIQQREEHIVAGADETPVERTVTLLYDDNGNCTGAMLVEKDITERRRQRNKKQALDQYQQAALADLQDKLICLSEGDLTIDPTVVPPESDYDELHDVYEEFTEMNENLGRAVDNIRETVEALTDNAAELDETGTSLSATAEEVTSAITQIDSSTTELASGSGELAEESQQANRNVDDLSASIEEITASLQQIDARSEEAADLVQQGVTQSDRAVEQIRQARDSTSTVAQRIDSLEESMAEVGDIIEIIAGIAEQTNLLALNANIEAARAGEDGDGFAVVANEVKSLAEESQESADEIATIIEAVQSQTKDLVDHTRNATEDVEQGAEAVETVGDRLETIAEQINETSSDVGEISDAVESQAHSAEEVSSVIDNTAGLSQELAASVEQISSGVDEQTEAMDEVARCAQQLSAMSEDTHQRIDLFKTDSDETANLENTV